MSLLQEIKPFVDGTGLVAPNLVPAGQMRGSDNGPLYTSELLIQLRLNGELIDWKYLDAIKKCIDSNGYLHRAPGDTTNDTADDHYGVLGMLSYYGIDIEVKLPILLWFQPILWHLILLKNKSLFSVLFSPVSAIIIAMSNMFDQTSDVSNRFLTWCAVRSLSKRSLLCYLASKIWLKRLEKDYGSTKMLQCAKLYFGRDNHPFARYFRT